MSDKNRLKQVNIKIGIKLNILLIMYANKMKIDKQSVVNPWMKVLRNIFFSEIKSK